MIWRAIRHLITSCFPYFPSRPFEGRSIFFRVLSVWICRDCRICGNACIMCFHWKYTRTIKVGSRQPGKILRNTNPQILCKCQNKTSWIAQLENISTNMYSTKLACIHALIVGVFFCFRADLKMYSKICYLSQGWIFILYSKI